MKWLEGLKAVGQDCLTVCQKLFKGIWNWIKKNKPAMFFIVSIVYYEIIIQAMTFGSIDIYFLYPVLFAIPVGCLLSLFSTPFHKIANGIIMGLFLLMFSFYYNFQMIYYDIFNDFFTFSLKGVAEDAMNTFADEIIHLIYINLGNIVILCVPLLVYLFIVVQYWIAGKPSRVERLTTGNHVEKFIGNISIYIKKNFYFFQRRPPKAQLVLSIVMILSYGITVLSLFIPGTGYHTPYDLYFNSGALSTQISKLGMVTATLQDMGLRPKYETGDKEVTLDPVDVPSIDVKPGPDGNKDPDNSNGDNPGTPNPEVTYNVLEIDFDAMIAGETNHVIKKLHEYYKTISGTTKNEYTGMFKGYNLIYICAESFSSGAIIEPELTPTLYKMATEGFIFNNYYTMFPSNTTNGEYAFCTGLIPDLAREKSNGSFVASKENYMPYCLGNAFDSIGVQAYAYHNHTKTYYSRNITHPNMGYIFKARNQGLSVTGWPESDYEMAKQSYGDFINMEQFHAYYMTVSGHYRYTFELKEDSDGNLVPLNYMAVKNKSATQKHQYNKNGEKYDEVCQAYLACHIELDKMLEELCKRLEEAGVLDKTVFVLGADHYPYGLSSKQYNNLVGETIDTGFDKYNSTLILYNSQMIHTMTEEERTVTKTCCAIDVLPTILNLFGFEYDSRLLSGNDVFSSAAGIAILSDQSFITDYVKYNASTRQITYLVDEYLIPQGYVEAVIEVVKNKCTASTAILNNDYYAILFPEAAAAHAASMKK